MAKAKERWNALERARSAPLRRARDASKVTLPGLVPEIGQDDNTPLPTPYQSLGARGVNNLASKLLMALYPPSVAFFKLNVSAAVREKVGEGKTEMQSALANYAHRVSNKVEATNYRPVVFLALKHLIVAGNVLLFMPASGDMRMFRMDQYVLQRSATGAPVEAVCKESLHASGASDDVLSTAGVKREDDETLELFTHIQWMGDRVTYYQEVDGKVVKSSQGDTPASSTPWVPLRWQPEANRSYSDGLVGEYMGDLWSLEGISEAIVRFAALASKVLFLRHPNSSISEDDLADAESGDVIDGDENDIDVLSLQKYPDFNVAQSVAENLELRLSHAFLLTSGTIRNAERVTATEIRAMAQELEDVLGGVYTVLSQELQLPMVRRLIAVMTASNELPALPEGSVEPVITTGFDALGRNHETNKLITWLSVAKDTLGPEVLQTYVNPQLVLQRLGTNQGIEGLDELINTQQQVAVQQQQAAQQQMMMGAGPEAVKAAVQKATENSQQQEE